MMPIPPADMTALGILAMVIAGCIWAGKWLLTRLSKMFDAQDEAMKAIIVELRAMALAEQRESIDHETLRSSIVGKIEDARESITGEVEKIEDRLVDVVLVAVKKAADTQPITADDLPRRRSR